VNNKYLDNWAKVATELKRDALDCKEKYFELTNKSKRGEWTYQETGK
jgi:hypothetical protein